MSDLLAQRLAILQDLLELKCPVNAGREQLSEFLHDFLGNPVPISADHLLNAVTLYSEGVLTLEDLRSWSEFFEFRDDAVPQGKTEVESYFVAQSLALLAHTELDDRSSDLQISDIQQRARELR